MEFFQPTQTITDDVAKISTTRDDFSKSLKNLNDSIEDSKHAITVKYTSFQDSVNALILDINKQTPIDADIQTLITNVSTKGDIFIKTITDITNAKIAMQKAQDDLNAQIDALVIAVTKNPIPIPIPPPFSGDLSLSGGAIAGIVIAVVVVGALGIGYFVSKNKTSKSSSV